MKRIIHATVSTLALLAAASASAQDNSAEIGQAGENGLVLIEQEQGAGNEAVAEQNEGVVDSEIRIYQTGTGASATSTQEDGIGNVSIIGQTAGGSVVVGQAGDGSERQFVGRSVAGRRPGRICQQ
jgi:hypothetical protein